MSKRPHQDFLAMFSAVLGAQKIPEQQEHDTEKTKIEKKREEKMVREREREKWGKRRLRNSECVWMV